MRKREVNVLQETQPKGNGRSMVGREVPASLRDTSEPNITEISGLSTLRFSVGPLSLQYHEDLIKPLFSTLTPEFSNYMSMVSSGFTDLCFSNLIPPCSKSWTWLFPLTHPTCTSTLERQGLMRGRLASENEKWRPQATPPVLTCM